MPGPRQGARSRNLVRRVAGLVVESVERGQQRDELSGSSASLHHACTYSTDYIVRVYCVARTARACGFKHARTCGFNASTTPMKGHEL